MTGSKNSSAPPPPSSNRTCRFPASGFPKNTSLEGMRRQIRLGQRAETLPRNEVGRSLFWEQCSMCILTLLHAEFLAGLLGSTGVTPLPRYYEPNRLPFEPRRSYGFPLPVDGAECAPSLERVSQVPDDSVGIRCPLSPRRARPLHLFVASRSMTGFTPPGGLATLECLTRPNTGSRFRITADAFAFRGLDCRITPTAAR